MTNTPIQPQVSRVSSCTNKTKKQPSLLIKKISYSGEIDDNKFDNDLLINYNDNSSIQSYQPEVSDYHDMMLNENSNNNNNNNKFSRQISREDASSIIGGLNIQNSNNKNNSRISSPRILPSNVTKKVETSKKVNTNSNDLLLKNPQQNNEIQINNEIKNDDDLSFNEDNISISDLNNDETKKVFNFSLPFSNPTNPEEESGDEDEDKDEHNNDNHSDENSELTSVTHKEPTQHIHTEPNLISDDHHHHHDHHHIQPKRQQQHHHNIPILSKTFRKISHILPFKKSQSPDSIERPLLLRRSSHPEAPSPPPDVYVYWDDISHKIVPDEMADREDVRLKLERQESLDTLQEARYYKDIRHLDDGKFKALRKSIIPHAPSLAISQSITNKLSYVTTKIRSDSLIQQTINIPESTEKVIINDDSIIPITSNNIDVLSTNVINNNNNDDDDNDNNNNNNNNNDNYNENKLSNLNINNNNKSMNSINSNFIEKENLSNSIISNPFTNATKFINSIPISPINSISNFTQLSNDPVKSQIFDELDGDILIIGGYRGSILRDSKTHRRTWIPVLKAGLNIRKINLVLGPKDEDELRELNARDIIFNNKDSIKPTDKDYPNIYPDGMLTHIGPVDISRRLIKKLNSNPKVNVKDWGYDWRLSPELISKQLHEELKKIVSKQKVKKGVLIISHSMGGIITHGAMVIDPSLIRGIVYAGTPMPCANILGPLRFSDSILLSKDILTHEANFFMRSSFVFVPPSWGGEDENGKGGGMTLYRDLRTGKRIKIDFWDEKNWVIYNLSPLVSSVRLKHDIKNGIINLNNLNDNNLKNEIKKFLKIKINPDTELIVLDEISRLHEPIVSWIDSYQYLSRTLKRTKKFLKSLERNDNIKYPPMSQIFSNAVPSVKYSLVDGEEGIKRGEYYRFFYGPGDGVVYQGWNFPRERGRKRLEGPDKCGKGSIDKVSNIPDWRGREYGFGEKYAFDLCGRFRATTGHIGLLGDLDLVGQAIDAILVEERKRILHS
ncbi:hypothetical protein C6P40_003889 [Pichia californica]|uniref:Uncharacterized protein n=1 Tax=Pichia californica TaxID=460514 RepID=A0A9P7BHX6_9ASCO|nr:hypothetical protein C6P40_003889 [[Candida] californica]